MKRKVRPKNVGLVCAMAAIGMTGRQLSIETGISGPHLSRIICNRVDYPEPKTVKALCRALQKSAGELGLTEG